MVSPICIRVTEQERDRLKNAAAQANKTLTRFIKDAAFGAAAKVKKVTETTPHVHTGYPSYMRATIAEASRGGATSYRTVAHQLARHLAGEIPDSADYDTWQEELDRLWNLLYPARSREDELVLSWFDTHYPRIMKAIPRRRRQQFVEGIYEAADEERIELQT